MMATGSSKTSAPDHQSAHLTQGQYLNMHLLTELIFLVFWAVVILSHAQHGSLPKTEKTFYGQMKWELV
jgi:hypothetical protein